MLKRKIINGFGWSFVGTLVQNITKFLTLVVLARLITPEEFGVITASMVVISFSVIFTTLGVGQAIVQRPKINKNLIRTGFTLSIAMGIIFSVLIYCLSSGISIFFKMSQLEIVLKVLSISFFIQSFSIVATGLLQRDLKFKSLALIETFSYTIGYGFMAIFFALLDYGIWALVIAQLSQTLLATIMTMTVVRHNIVPLFNIKSVKELMYFGGGFTLARVFNYAATQGDNIVIGRLLGPTVLGLYGRIYQLMVMPANVIGQVLDKVLFSAMSRIQSDLTRLKQIYLRGVGLTATLVLPLSITCMIYAEEFILITIGENWISATSAFLILSSGMIFRTSYKMSESLTRALGAVYKRAWRQFVYACSIFLGCFIGHYWGLEGIAVGIVIALIINYVLMAQLSLKLIGADWSSFIKVHKTGALISFIILFLYLIIELIFDFDPLFIFLLNLVSSIVVLAILFKFYKGIVLGETENWLLKNIESLCRGKMKWKKIS
ncbi:lipopolysaccharide biosynthesis protein [Alkalihalobacillus sp. 1P02AB]|uniref:lipopolysaccharide biosynthesis protein n=1 Tax=Alkalihalobacillus sp. 1P02AB TaxID=3132260 RepID=UPI0039A49639